MSPAADPERVRIVRDVDLVFVTLDDPNRANALSIPIIEGLTEVYRRDWLAEGVRALVLAGEGRHFSAGADLEHLGTLLEAGPEENRVDSERLRNLFSAVLEQDALTVAAVQGSCVAGGCGLATAHDFVVAAESAQFMYSEVKIGFVAALVATFLPLRVSGRDLRELLLKPEFVSSRRALEIGLVNRVVPAESLLESSRLLAIEILRNASSSAIALTKKLIRESLGRPLAEALDEAARVNAEARTTADCRLGIETFLETKKPPQWR